VRTSTLVAFLSNSRNCLAFDASVAALFWARPSAELSRSVLFLTRLFVGSFLFQSLFLVIPFLLEALLVEACLLLTLLFLVALLFNALLFLPIIGHF
jgi:hypothetical protein